MNLKNANMDHASVAENVTIKKINFKLAWTHLDSRTYYQKKNQKGMKNIFKSILKMSFLHQSCHWGHPNKQITDLNENLDFFCLFKEKVMDFLILC